MLEKLKDYLLLITGMAFWGLSWPITKILVGMVPQILVGFFRFAIASCVFIPVFFMLKKRKNRTYDKKFLRDIAILGVLGIFGYGMLYLTALTFTSSSHGAMIAGVQPALISLLAHIFHKERLKKKWQYTGFVLSFIGVLVIIGLNQIVNKFRPEYLIGDIIVFVAFILWSLYTIYGKTVMKKHSSFEATAGATVIGMILFGISAAIQNDWNVLVGVDRFFWIGVAILGLLPTVLGFYFYFTAVTNIGATHTGIFINLVPVFGTLFTFFILPEEKIGWTLIVGLILIISGVLLINYPLKDEKQKVEETTEEERSIDE